MRAIKLDAEDVRLTVVHRRERANDTVQRMEGAFIRMFDGVGKFLPPFTFGLCAFLIIVQLWLHCHPLP